MKIFSFLKKTTEEPVKEDERDFSTKLYYDDKPMSKFWKDLDEDYKIIKEINRIWSIEHKKVIETYKQANELEQSNPMEAIKLYESIKNTNYGNFDTLSRLIILYRKTKQKEKELQHIEFKIEELQNKEYNRMEFLSNKYPDESEYIRECYESGKDCFLLNGFVINFKREIINLQKRIN